MWNALGKILTVALIAGAATAVIYLSMDAIRNWMMNNIRHDSKQLVVVKEALANGNYGLIAGVINYDDEVTASNTWQNVAMDEELEAIFHGEDTATIIIQH
ncbi:MAG: hypothetical protein R3A44_27255 [Caldilineaceae bacterium]